VRRAVFLDRDRTIIENVHHLADPALVRLIPGAVKGIQMLRDRGFACVVVSNQSAVGRGLLTLETLELIHKEMCRQLAQEGTAVDGWYFCPKTPKTSDRTAIDHPDRKPAPGMLLRAAKELDLEVDSSWMVGDMVSDVMAGHNAGCMGTILVKTGFGGDQTEANALATYVAKDLLLAAQWLIAKE
jgi:D-glycero-D-manno-heptose 1,7-bisphosphate phosphatase